VNQVIESYKLRDVFLPARKIVDDLLKGLTRLAALEDLLCVRVPVDLVSLSEFTLGSLCTAWFGLPDNALMILAGRSTNPIPARCPGHFLTLSRFIFGPHPNPHVTAEANAQGRAVLAAFKALLAQKRPLARWHAISRRACSTFQAWSRGMRTSWWRARSRGHARFSAHGGRQLPAHHGQPDQKKRLWQLQQSLLESKAATPDPFVRAQAALLNPLLETMREHPLPDAIWRTAVDGASVGGVRPIDPDGRVVVGLASAVSESPDPLLMFGGKRTVRRRPCTPVRVMRWRWAHC